ncbi:DUF1194 domain-containing protein [Pikeienuella piscinae]|uniref:DUF1194 domain-containing protein n=1 Tax=Pikeienuella piscinae TaxID=2748098 RepID=A0A7L5C122_9RHOB|nr:DUF1194 domain-containing protein [Pikeienuella piscinae]QIE56487.1 DUF1194 domain-containing protein [Pikeienuella piscinae]
MNRGALFVAAALFAGTACACETALVLAIDVSGSVDPSEYRLQMGGLAAALRDPTVIDALVDAKAMVAVMQWSGSSRQHVAVPWTQVMDQAAAARLAHDVETAPRAFRHFSTAIGDALAASADLLGAIAAHCRRQVVDISGDGVSNEGLATMRMRDALVRGGVRINGLAIETGDDGLTAYYRREVIGGGGAFVLTARNFEDYPRAIRRKLLRELTDPVARRGPAIQRVAGGR